MFVGYSVLVIEACCKLSMKDNQPPRYQFAVKFNLSYHLQASEHLFLLC